jgi:hypothetical protein
MNTTLDMANLRGNGSTKLVFLKGSGIKAVTKKVIHV